MTLVNFRQAINSLRKPIPYCPVVTEFKGITNLAVGCLQLVSSQLMKCSTNQEYRTTIAARHVQIGTAAVKQGLQELFPAVCVIGAGYLMRNWIVSSRDLSPAIYPS